MSDRSNTVPDDSRKFEWQAFTLIAVVLFPVLSIIGVAGYGFFIWMLQAIFGPPGHG